MNMIRGVLEANQVVSVMAPYTCRQCGRQHIEEVGREELDHSPPPARKCSSCREWLEFDELPDEYFGFRKSR
jgi:hypothetical protein